MIFTFTRHLRCDGRLVEQGEASASRSPWSWPVSQISQHLLYQPEGLRFILWERGLQIILSPGHGQILAILFQLLKDRLEASTEQGNFFFPGESFPPELAFSDTFRQALRFWSFNTLPLHPYLHTNICKYQEIHIQIVLALWGTGVTWVICSPSQALGAGTPGLKEQWEKSR